MTLLRATGLGDEKGLDLDQDSALCKFCKTIKLLSFSWPSPHSAAVIPTNSNSYQETKSEESCMKHLLSINNG